MARKYTTVSGDTLFAIAQRFYGDGSMFPIITSANSIANPDSLPVGQVLLIPDLPRHSDVFRTHGDMISESLGRCVLPDKVPAGRRLVIETVTGMYNGDEEILGAAFLSHGAAGTPRYAFPWILCGTAFDGKRRFFAFNHSVRIYVDGPATLQFDAAGGASVGGGIYDHPDGEYSISGFLEGLPPA